MKHQCKPVAVVTGGRQGLGRGCAMALADRGFDLVIIDLHDDEVAKETLVRLEEKGVRTRFMQGDIAELDGHAALTRIARSAIHGLDLGSRGDHCAAITWSGHGTIKNWRSNKCTWA